MPQDLYIVTTNPATDITETSAKLHGNIYFRVALLAASGFIDTNDLLLYLFYDNDIMEDVSEVDLEQFEIQTDIMGNSYSEGIAPMVTGSGVFCPENAEGYDKDGNLVVDLVSTGWVMDTAGMIVFKSGTHTVSYKYIDECELLVVAGGGGPGYSSTTTTQNAGAGGAGGVLYDPCYKLLSPLNEVFVRVGGIVSASVGNSLYPGRIGNWSRFEYLFCFGGGGGGSTDNRRGGVGGSGGGACAVDSNTDTGGEALANPFRGHNGGNSVANTSGGGGGAGSAASGINGGDGVDYFGFTYGQGGRGVSDTGFGSGASDAILNSGNGASAPPNNVILGDEETGIGSSGIVIMRWGGYNHDYNPTL